jgi:hypothetical protein
MPEASVLFPKELGTNWSGANYRDANLFLGSSIPLAGAIFLATPNYQSAHSAPGVIVDEICDRR